jgi:hypothetical protein
LTILREWPVSSPVLEPKVFWNVFNSYTVRRILVLLSVRNYYTLVRFDDTTSVTDEYHFLGCLHLRTISVLRSYVAYQEKAEGKRPQGRPRLRR